MKSLSCVQTVILTAVFGLFCPAGSLHAQTGLKAAIEAARRQDPTGNGTYHRVGMLRDQDNVVRAQQAANAGDDEPKKKVQDSTAQPGKPKKNRFFLWRWLFRD